MPGLIDPTNSQYDELLSGRYGIWRKALSLYLYSSHIYNKFIGMGYNIKQSLLQSHNDTISILVRTGIIPLSIFYIFISIINKPKYLEAQDQDLKSIFSDLILHLAQLNK